mgnify:FL=1
MAIRTAVNRALTAITALPTAAALAEGNLTLLTTATASNSATLDFTSGIDDTYDSYVFKFYNIHPSASGNTKFTFNMSIDAGSNYNVTKTSTFYVAYNKEDDGEAVLAYDTGYDLAQSTDFQEITSGVGGAVADENACGTLQIFNPSSTTFVKHFICSSNSYRGDFVGSFFQNIAGYANTTSAVDAIRFQFSTGNIDSGVIKLYGVGPKQ